MYIDLIFRSLLVCVVWGYKTSETLVISRKGRLPSHLKAREQNDM